MSKNQRTVILCCLVLRFAMIPSVFNVIFMPNSCSQESERMIQKYTQVYDKIGGLKKEEINFENCIKVCHKLKSLKINFYFGLSFPAFD